MLHSILLLPLVPLLFRFRFRHIASFVWREPGLLPCLHCCHGQFTIAAAFACRLLSADTPLRCRHCCCSYCWLPHRRWLLLIRQLAAVAITLPLVFAGALLPLMLLPATDVTGLLPAIAAATAVFRAIIAGYCLHTATCHWRYAAAVIIIVAADNIHTLLPCMIWYMLLPLSYHFDIAGAILYIADIHTPYYIHDYCYFLLLIIYVDICVYNRQRHY